MALTIDELNIQIAANSSNATRALTSLIKKLEQLKSTLNGSNVSNITISNSFNKTTNAINKTTTATQKHDNAVKKTSKSTKSFSDNLAQQISKWRTLLGVFQSAARTMSGWFKESNNYIETLNLFNVTMGEGAEEARKYAESVQSLMGIDIAEWMKYQGTFKQLTSGFGVASEKANVMSKNLTQLSYDMASFFNTDVETAFDKLSSAMSGQVKGLREFGIDTTVASLQEYALARGIDTSVRSMTQAEKSMLRYNYIMEKSIIIQGDMARTIATPANALRILGAQFTQLKRALGNVVSVIAVKLIPYVQAMVRILTEAAISLANFFGFELPEIDYSDLGSGLSNSLEDAEESAEGVSGSIKKIKKQLMGFDELNIISEPDAGGGGSAGAGVGGLGDMQPLEYDFLKNLDTSKADEIYKKIKDFLKPLKKIGNYLSDYGDTIKAIIGLFIGYAIIRKLSSFLPALKGWIGGVGKGLTTMQKLTTVAFAGVIEFFAIKDSVKALAMGCEDVGAKIATIGVAAGVAAAAMYAALGPAGLVIAAMVGISAAIIGIDEAYDAMMQQLVDEVFYNGVGENITDIANKFKEFSDSIIETNQPILDNKAKIEEAEKAIKNTAGEIEKLTKAYERGVIPAEDYAKQMAEKLSTLNDDVKIIMDGIYDNIIYALSTSLGDAIEQAGGSVSEYLKIIGKIKEDGDNLYTELVADQEELTKQFENGDISADEYAKKLNEVNSKLAALTGSGDLVSKFADKIDGLRTAVNWENEEARNNAFDTIKSSATDAKASINESCDEIKRNLEAMKAWTDDEDSLLALDELILGNEESRKAQIAAIDTEIALMFQRFAEDLAPRVHEIEAAAKKEWENIDGWDAFFGGTWTEEDYVKKAISKYRSSIELPILGAIKDAAEEIGIEGSKEFSESFINISKYGLSSHGIDEFGNAYKEALKVLGGNAVDGYKEGVDKNAYKASDAVEEMTKCVIDTVAETQDSHSPSKEFIKLAKDAVDGYEQGVTENFPNVERTFTKSFTDLFEKIKKLVSEKIKDVAGALEDFSVDDFTKTLDGITTKAKSVFSSSTWEGYANNITKALAKIKMPTFSDIGLSVSFSTWVSEDKKKVFEALGLSGWPRLNWYTYASGGFPSVGEMFIAREAGPELVGSIGRKTAVANNDQIVSGIESGVYRAMMAANSNNSGGSQTIRIINEIDGDVVGEKVIQYHNGKVIQTGASPLLI